MLCIGKQTALSHCLAATHSQDPLTYNGNVMGRTLSLYVMQKIDVRAGTHFLEQTLFRDRPDQTERKVAPVA